MKNNKKNGKKAHRWKKPVTFKEVAQGQPDHILRIYDHAETIFEAICKLESLGASLYQDSDELIREYLEGHDPEDVITFLRLSEKCTHPLISLSADNYIKENGLIPGIDFEE